MRLPTDPSADSKGVVPDWERELDFAFDQLESGTLVERSPDEPKVRVERQAALWQRDFRA